MSYLLVGKGAFTEELLKEKLLQLGFSDPDSVIKEAKERKIAVRGRYRIMAFVA
ncbi:hypothetical protein GCM10023310_70560 [Paenibacillus vulneris]|uniref:Uncharacterized protein n=1 Tax=Paenibacillus vulneris TaxID=1133364 RepID=A0ABW3UF08_9BACL